MKSKEIVWIALVVLVLTLVTQSLQFVYADDSSTGNSVGTTIPSNTTSSAPISTSSNKIDDHKSTIAQKIAEHRADVLKKIAEYRAAVAKRIADHRVNVDTKIADHRANVDTKIAQHQTVIDEKIKSKTK